MQTRWEHINQDYSLITKLRVPAAQRTLHGRTGQYVWQATICCSSTVRVGVWRHETIDDAGGWEADTLTEDFDLSIRAQLKAGRSNTWKR